MSNVNCLITVPADDCNFKAALGYASIDELREAEESLYLRLQVGFKVKSRLDAVRREIRKRIANRVEAKPEQEGGS